MDLKTDLKTRKLIQNTNRLPGFVPGFEAEIKNPPNPNAPSKSTLFKTAWKNGLGESVTNSAIAGLGALSLMSSQPINNANSFVGKYGTNDEQIDGISYKTYKDVDWSQEENRLSAQRNATMVLGGLSGAAVGASIGAGLTAGLSSIGWAAGPIGAIAGLGLGTLFGGIFGNSSKKKEEEQLRRAQKIEDNYNESARNNALTAALQQRQFNELGDTRSQTLFSAEGGSEGVRPSNRPIKVTNKPVHTLGSPTDMANGRVNYGEEMMKTDKNGNIINAKTITGDPNKVDGEFANIGKNTSIFTNSMLVPGTNVTYADMARIMEGAGVKNYSGLLQSQANTREAINARNNNNGMMTAKYGRECLPKFWNGYENLLANGIGLTTSLGDYWNTSADDILNVNITPIHKYEGTVADLMGGRRANWYPVSQDMLNQEAKTRYGTSQSGGLSVGLRTLANLANSMNTRLGRAQALLNIQNMNNQYAKENAEMLNNMGTSLMNAKLDADKFNTQMNAQAHNAYVQQKNMAKYNALNYLTQYFKSDWERKQFYETMSRYDQKLANDRIAIEAMMGGKGNNRPTDWAPRMVDFIDKDELKPQLPGQSSIFYKPKSSFDESMDEISLNRKLTEYYNNYLKSLPLPYKTIKRKK